MKNDIWAHKKDLIDKIFKKGKNNQLELINQLLIPAINGKDKHLILKNYNDLISCNYSKLKKINGKSSKQLFSINIQNMTPKEGIRFVLLKQRLIDAIIRRYILMLKDIRVEYNFGRNHYSKNLDYLGKSHENNNNVVAGLLDILTAQRINIQGKIKGLGKIGINRKILNEKGEKVELEFGWGIQDKIHRINELRSFFKMFEPFILIFKTKSNLSKFENTLMKDLFLSIFYCPILDQNRWVKVNSRGLLEKTNGVYFSSQKREGFISAWEFLKKNYGKIGNMNDDDLKEFYPQFCNVFADLNLKNLDLNHPQWRNFLKNRDISSNQKIRKIFTKLLLVMNKFENYGYLTSKKQQNNRLFRLNSKKSSLFSLRNDEYILSTSAFLQNLKTERDRNIGLFMNMGRFDYLMYDDNAIGFYRREINIFMLKNLNDSIFFGEDEKLGTMAMDELVNYIFKSCGQFSGLENDDWTEIDGSWKLNFPYGAKYFDNEISKYLPVEMLLFSLNLIQEIRHFDELNSYQKLDFYFRRGVESFGNSYQEILNPLMKISSESLHNLIFFDKNDKIYKFKPNVNLKYHFTQSLQFNFRSFGEYQIILNILKKLGIMVQNPDIIDFKDSDMALFRYIIKPKYNQLVQKIIDENTIYSILSAKKDLRMKSLTIEELFPDINKKIAKISVPFFVQDFLYRIKYKGSPIDSGLKTHVDLFLKNNNITIDDILTTLKFNLKLSVNREGKHVSNHKHVVYKRENSHFIPKNTFGNSLKHDFFAFGIFWERSDFTDFDFVYSYGKAFQYVRKKIQSVLMGHFRGRPMGFVVPNRKIFFRKKNGKLFSIHVQQFYYKIMKKMDITLPIIRECDFDLIFDLNRNYVDLIRSMIKKMNILKNNVNEINDKLIQYLEFQDELIGENSLLHAIKKVKVEVSNGKIEDNKKSINEDILIVIEVINRIFSNSKLKNSKLMLKMLFLLKLNALKLENCTKLILEQNLCSIKRVVVNLFMRYRKYKESWKSFQNDVLSYFQKNESNLEKYCIKTIQLLKISKIENKEQFKSYIFDHGPIEVSFPIPNSNNFLAIWQSGYNMGELATFDRLSGKMIIRKKNLEKGSYFKSMEENEINIAGKDLFSSHKIAFKWIIDNFKDFQSWWIYIFKRNFKKYNREYIIKNMSS